MSLRDHLVNNPSFVLENNLFYQKGVNRAGSFEREYIKLREREGRIYPDEIVKSLPSIPSDHVLKKEWALRMLSMKKLITYLERKRQDKTVLDVGCGNGWLSHALSISLDADVCGMDVNETELLQGVRVFTHDKKLSFLYSDIFTVDFNEKRFDTIILASSIQYFADIKRLMNRLLEMLTPSGEIHILDSPIYSSSSESEKARRRSLTYFESLGFPEMTNKYFHHTLQEINGLNYEFLFKPQSLINKISRGVLSVPVSPFPWIIIRQA